MANAYHCQECGTSVIVAAIQDSNGHVMYEAIKGCHCNAPIVADMSVTMTGTGGLK